MSTPIPVPRLRVIQLGETFILHGERKPRVLLEKDRRRGHFDSGYASLCHPLDPTNLVWAAGGWQVRN